MMWRIGPRVCDAARVGLIIAASPYISKEERGEECGGMAISGPSTTTPSRAHAKQKYVNCGAVQRNTAEYGPREVGLR